MTSTTGPATPVFDRNDAGTREASWASSGRADGAVPLDLTGVERLVVLSAHPDDETLGAAGLIQRLHAAGARVQVLVASDGEGSHPDSPTHPPERIAARRRTEMTAALAALAPTAGLHRLGLPDGSLTGHQDELTDALGHAVGPAGAGVLIAAPWRGDGHPDHEAVALVTDAVARERGARLVEFPIWAWHWDDPADPRLPTDRLARLDLTGPERAAKRAAIAEHRSQTTALSPADADRPVLGAAFLAHFDRPHELFVEAARSLPAGYFDRLYRASADPWRLGESWYERRKRALTVACLTRPRFGSAFEPGCATGLLTELLAPRCDRLLATDVAAAAVAATRRRVAAHPQVDVQRRAVPAEWPAGTFDLIVLSEVGYYCDRTDLGRVIDRAAGSLTEDGVLIACHWRHPAPYPLTGDQVHDTLIAHPGLAVAVAHVEEDVRLDVLTRPGAPSVARWDGVLA